MLQDLIHLQVKSLLNLEYTRVADVFHHRWPDLLSWWLKLLLQIRGFPTIKIFQKGEDPVDYDGGRTRSDIVARALDLFSDNAPPPELLEVPLHYFFSIGFPV